MDEPAPPIGRRDATLALLVWTAGCLGLWSLRQAAGLWGALGTDAVLWGLSAVDLRLGGAPLVPPGYPLLVRLLTAAGVDLVRAGWSVSLLAAAAVGAVTFLGSRAAGATRAWALCAGALALCWPDLAAFGQQVQPDALAALGLVAVAALVVGGGRRRLLAAALVAGLLPLVREHGVVLVGCLGLWWLARRELRPLLVLLVAWWLGPLLAGVAPGWNPLVLPWTDRAGGALAALLTDDPGALSYARELPPPARAAYLELVRGPPLGQIAWHVRRSLQLAPELWLLVGTALAALAGSRWRGGRLLALPLLTALPALLIWSQRRHVAVVIPVALVALAAARGPVGRPLRGAAFLLLVGAGIWRWPGVLAGQQSEVHRARSLATAGAWLCAEAPAGSLLGGVVQDVGLYCPLPRHDPDGSAADWSTFVVGELAPPWPAGAQGRWRQVHDTGRGLRVWRLDPDRQPRPCAGAAVAPGTPHVTPFQAHATLVGCEAPAN